MWHCYLSLSQKEREVQATPPVTAEMENRRLKRGRGESTARMDGWMGAGQWRERDLTVKHYCTTSVLELFYRRERTKNNGDSNSKRIKVSPANPYFITRKELLQANHQEE